MDTSTLTQKGQVTIPVGIRRKLGLRTGDQVAFVQEGDRVLVKPVQKKISAAFGLAQAKRGASLTEMDQAIRKRARR